MERLARGDGIAVTALPNRSRRFDPNFKAVGRRLPRAADLPPR
jgi:hypothetical protein